MTSFGFGATSAAPGSLFGAGLGTTAAPAAAPTFGAGGGLFGQPSNQLTLGAPTTTLPTLGALPGQLQQQQSPGVPLLDVTIGKDGQRVFTISYDRTPKPAAPTTGLLGGMLTAPGQIGQPTAAAAADSIQIAPSADIFKAIAYSYYNLDDSGGDRVGILVKMQDEASLRTAILTYESNLKQLFSNYPAKVESTKLLPANRALLTVSVTDPTSNKKVNSAHLLLHLSQPHIRQQLSAAFQQNFLDLVPFNSVAKQELDEYLKQPPAGISAELWAQAKRENPDPTRLIPVPLIGFGALNQRFKMQEQEVNQQKKHLKAIADEVNRLERAVEASRAKLEDCRKRSIPLRTAVLKIMIYQEVMKKRGYPIQPDEEKLRARLESMQAELTAPAKFKGCLSELICRVRQMQSQRAALPMFSLEEPAMAELKQHLKQEQQGIGALLAIVKEDMAILNRIKAEVGGGNE